MLNTPAPFFAALVALYMAITAPLAAASDAPRPEEAFRYRVDADHDAIYVVFTIHEDTYLYRSRFSFEALTPNVELGPVVLPPGEVHEDEFLGQQEIYRYVLEVKLPYTKSPEARSLALRMNLQGCAEKAGICYLPQSWTTTVELP